MTPEYYEQQAQLCEERAKAALFDDVRQAYLKLAQDWRELKRQAENRSAW